MRTGPLRILWGEAHMGVITAKRAMDDAHTAEQDAQDAFCEALQHGEEERIRLANEALIHAQNAHDASILAFTHEVSSHRPFWERAVAPIQPHSVRMHA